jgi:hypothetical protein
MRESTRESHAEMAKPALVESSDTPSRSALAYRIALR